MVNDLRSSRLFGDFVHQVTTLVFYPGHQADAFESGIDAIPQIQLAGNGNAGDSAAVRELGIVIPGQLHEHILDIGSIEFQDSFGPACIVISVHSIQGNIAVRAVVTETLGRIHEIVVVKQIACY